MRSIPKLGDLQLWNSNDHGSRKYPDIASWDYTGLLKVLGDFGGIVSRSYKARTKQELSDLLDNEEFGNAKFIQLVEIFMDKLDAPRALADWPPSGKK